MLTAISRENRFWIVFFLLAKVTLKVSQYFTISNKGNMVRFVKLSDQLFDMYFENCKLKLLHFRMSVQKRV